MAEHEQRILAQIPKNTKTEIFIMAKTLHIHGSPEPSKFIDVREVWYKDGFENEPQFTAKGAMIPRKNIGRALLAIIREMEPGELSEDAKALTSAMRAATGSVDVKDLIIEMMQGLSQSDVDDIIAAL